jgi:hypothetical protein
LKHIKFFLKEDSIISWVYPYKDGGMKDFFKSSQVSNKNKVYVNGWDYSIPPYLEVCPIMDDFARMHGGMIEMDKFYSSVYSRKYDWILDIINYSGIVKDEKYALENNTIFQKIVINEYKLMSFGSHFSAYKIK